MTRPTAIWNRESILELLTRERARAEREGGSLCVMLAGIDRFKDIARQHGTSLSDSALGEVARRLNALLHPYDHVGRYSAEQLLIVAPSCKPEDGGALAEKLRQSAAQAPVEVAETAIPVTLSLAVATSADLGPPGDEALLRELEKLQYQAEANGGNRVAWLHRAGAPARSRRSRPRVRTSLVLAGALLATIFVVAWLAPSWLCAPFLIGDIFDTSELPAPLPVNCVPTTQSPSQASQQSFEERRAARGLVLLGTYTCKVPASLGAHTGRVTNQQWMDSIYVGGSLQYRRKILLAASQELPDGTLFTVETCLMPWWKYINEAGDRCWERIEFWK